MSSLFVIIILMFSWFSDHFYVCIIFCRGHLAVCMSAGDFLDRLILEMTFLCFVGRIITCLLDLLAMGPLQILMNRKSYVGRCCMPVLKCDVLYHGVLYVSVITFKLTMFALESDREWRVCNSQPGDAFVSNVVTVKYTVPARWKVMVVVCYHQAFNTFIDDVFAFIITMPTAHRLACFRDDIVFVIYLYQRWSVSLVMLWCCTLW